MTKWYSSFKLLNLKTKEETLHPYLKTYRRTKDSEDIAIRKQMEITGQPRNDFMVIELIP